MSTTPAEPQDQGTPRTDDAVPPQPATPDQAPTERLTVPESPESPEHARPAAPQSATAAAAAPAQPQEAPTQRIAPAPTQQLPYAAARAQETTPVPTGAPQPTTPVPTTPQPPAPYGHAPIGTPAPGVQPQYGQPAPQQQPGSAQHAGQPQHTAPAQPHNPQAPGDPLAVFRTAAPAGPGTPGGDGPTGGPESPANGAPAATATRPRSNGTSIWLPVAGVGVAAALLASLGTAALTGAFDSGTTRDADASSIGRTSNDTTPVSGSSNENPDWQAVASAVQSSVVSIQVAGNAGETQGSGVIVDTAGHIVTNNHVVSGAQDGKVQVTLTDGRIYTADVVGTDATTDLAVIKLQDAPDDLSPAALGDSNEVTVGDPVMAVGNPLGLANTVTTGIVSALDRPVSTAENGANETVVTNAIQIDAAINPGNSGGPLFDAQGRVIGITSSIATTSSESGSIGLGFAIPVNLADMIAGQLIEDGTAEHAFLGVGLSDGMATADGVTRSGAQVQTVSDGSPAASAGLQQGDTIVAIDGRVVAGAESLTGYVRAHASGDEVTLTVIRDGKALEVDVTLATREETDTAGSPGDSGQGGQQAPGQGGLENMTPEQLWEWFQQQQGGGQG